MKKIKTIPIQEIENAVYGEGGYADRVVDKIKEIGTTEAGVICHKSTQTMNSFVNWRSSRKYRPKLETVREYCEKLEVS